ncbi:MAG: hypothetical protein ACRD3D_12225 [Terriglobia bacterium]
MNHVPPLASFHLLERTGSTAPRLADPGAEVLRALDGLRFETAHLAGKRIAVAVGSRGIASLRDIVRAACGWLAAQGANPFIFPAMGSHGGATAEGQRQVLAGYGVTQEFTGAEIRSSMETVSLAATPEGFPVFMDRNASEADGVLVISRSKPHTRFSGKIESGLVKMMAIGMGKAEGAAEYHRLATRHGFEALFRSVASRVVSSGKILAGVSVVENALHEIAVVRAAKPGEMIALDEEMLALAKTLSPRIPFSRLDLLIVDEIGKNISGSGMDTNVIGRGLGVLPGAEPQISLIYARSLTRESEGNSLGVGMADLIHERLYQSADFEKMYVNARTSLNPEMARMPMRFGSDREALGFALSSLGSPGRAEQRAVSIANTLSLSRILISEAMVREARELSGWRVHPGSAQLAFDAQGNLPLPLAHSH